MVRLDGGTAHRPVAPGRYTVVSYTRGCSAVCPNLDRGRDGHCRTRVEVADGQTAVLRIRTQAGERCSVSR